MERFEGDGPEARGPKPNFDATKRNFRSQFRWRTFLSLVARAGILAKVEYKYSSTGVLQSTEYYYRAYDSMS